MDLWSIGRWTTRNSGWIILFTIDLAVSTNIDLEMLDDVDKYRDEIEFYSEFCKFRDLIYITVE